MPFCRRRCFYCDFNIVVVGDKGPNAKAESYVDLVLAELATTERTEPLLSCYFGGGTPSLVAPALVGRIIEAVDAKLGLASHAEVTLEADPGTFQSLDAYKRAGITRVSLGAQSFNDAELEAAGRAHTAADVRRAIDVVTTADLEHGWSLDLMSGLPRQTLQSWRRTLEEAVACRPDHISAYDLQIQAGTAFARWYGDDRDVLFADDEPVVSNNGRPPLPSEDTAALMYEEASSFLRDSGYDHYEISSYARTRRSVHNALYWEPGGSWYALGLGATSAHAVHGARYPKATRRQRPTTLTDYESYVSNGCPDFGDKDDDDVLDALADDVLTSLRTAAGLPLARVRALAGHDPLHAVLRGAQSALEDGHAEVAVVRTPRPRTMLRLTDPRGFLFSNAVIASIFHELACLRDAALV